MASKSEAEQELAVARALRKFGDMTGKEVARYLQSLATRVESKGVSEQDAIEMTALALYHKVLDPSAKGKELEDAFLEILRLDDLLEPEAES